MNKWRSSISLCLKSQCILHEALSVHIPAPHLLDACSANYKCSSMQQCMSVYRVPVVGEDASGLRSRNEKWPLVESIQ